MVGEPRRGSPARAVLTAAAAALIVVGVFGRPDPFPRIGFEEALALGERGGLDGTRHDESTPRFLVWIDAERHEVSPYPTAEERSRINRLVSSVGGSAGSSRLVVGPLLFEGSIPLWVDLLVLPHIWLDLVRPASIVWTLLVSLVMTAGVADVAALARAPGGLVVQEVVWAFAFVVVPLLAAALWLALGRRARQARAVAVGSPA